MVILGALLVSMMQRQRRALAARHATAPGSVPPPLAKGKAEQDALPGAYANPLFYDGPVMEGPHKRVSAFVPPPSAPVSAADTGESEA